MEYQDIVKEMVEKRNYQIYEKGRKPEVLQWVLSENILKSIIENNDLVLIKIWPASYLGIQIYERVIREDNKIWLIQKR